MMTDQVVMLVQKMRGIEYGFAFVVLNEVPHKIAAADADEIVPHIEGAEYARLVAAPLDIWVQVQLNRFFEPAQDGFSASAPVGMRLGQIYLPLIGVADVFVQLQPAFSQQLAQDIGDEGVGADDGFAVIGGCN